MTESPAHRDNMAAEPVKLYLTPPHPCPYLPGLDSVNLLADPARPLDPWHYGRLVLRGFRRSGNWVYRPRCPHCDACVPVRVPVQRFRPDRSQRRCLRRNADLAVHIALPQRTDEYFDLYRRYLQARHPGGGMDRPTPAQFEEFLIADWCETRFVEFRHQGRLLAVAVVDLLPDGLSAVYTFYEPAETRRGLGTLAVLWQIGEARRRRQRHVYLGYWIEQSPKMRYKIRFQPLEGYRDGQWLPLPADRRSLDPGR